MIVPFENETTSGNERAIRRGKQVPEDAVNLAWVQSPELTPENNVVIIDTSRIVEENALEAGETRALYGANSLGVLEHLETGSQLIDEEFPYVTDVFSIDQDFLTHSAAHYRPEHVLPFVHVSRHFHLDFAGLTLPKDLMEFDESVIKVIDGRGRGYLDSDGKPRYKIRITPAETRSASGSDQAAYRVYAYVDTDQFEELYLVYNKVELTLENEYKRQLINYRELLNVRPVFDYVPEESEVVDRANVEKKIYSTKPVTMKEQVLGIPFPNVDGYRVYVPKKAIGDPRIFQLFHWRLACDFVQPYNVDETRNQVIRCGVVVTRDGSTSGAPYCLLNLARSAFNATGVPFENPLHTISTTQGSDEAAKETAAYWYVNIDTVSYEELQQFDFLVWAPMASPVNFEGWAAKIDYFTRVVGGTLFIDTSSYAVTTGLGLTTSNGVGPNGAVVTTGSTNGGVSLASITVDNTDVLIDGSEQLAGWNLLDGQNNDEIRSLTYVSQLFAPGYSQTILNPPADWKVVVRAGGAPVTVRKANGNGQIIFSTLGQLNSCGALYSSTTNALLSANRGPTLYAAPNYLGSINGSEAEGAMKFLFNVARLAVKGRLMSDGDERAYSTSWTYNTDWESSWVINADDGALDETEQARHAFTQEVESAATPTSVWKRKLDARTCDEMMNAVLLSDPVLARRQEGAVRKYRIEVTNKEAVRVDPTPNGADYPLAWTTAYTPKFVVPVELGPHVIRDTEIDGTYTTNEEYGYQVYESRPYAGFVRASYAITSEQLTTKYVNWTAHGTAQETIQITKEYPAVYSEAYDVTLSWHNYPQTGVRNYYQIGEDFKPRLGYMHPVGIASWQEHNYYGGASGNAHLNWPFMGMTGRLVQGSRFQHGQDPATGDVTQFVQEFLNRSIGAGLAVDGNFGSRTEAAVRAFQTRFGARYIDGIIDAETWSIIGFQILRLGMKSGGRGDYYRFFDYPWFHTQMQHISDGAQHTSFSKRSWTNNGPSIIWDLFQVTFNQQYDIHAVTVVPYLEGQTQTLILRSIKISNAFSMVGWNEGDAQLRGLPFRPRNGENLRIPLGPYRGDTITIGLGQDGPAGGAWGSGRMFGIRDLLAHTTMPPHLVTAGRTETTSQTNTFNFQASGSLAVLSFRDEVRHATLSYSGPGQLSQVRWNTVSTNPATPDVAITINGDGLITFRHQEVTRGEAVSYADGPSFGPGAVSTYYSMDEDGHYNPVREVGQISIADGIKLLCKSDKTPYGFPEMPTDIGANETQRHYTTLTLSKDGTDSNVMLGFYDISRREFITDNGLKNGLPVMTYVEWMARGRHNVYIAAISSLKAPVVMRQIPEDDDAPKLPYRWAMPVYGVGRHAGARITLEPLPNNLGTTDIWPAAVRDGRFNRLVLVRPRSEGFLTTYLKDYQGSRVRAFYGIPESAGWSTLHGPPFADVIGEEPVIIDDNVIRVRQVPIHLVAEPTIFPGFADPVRPAFTVYKRETAVSPWVALAWSEIRDYNVSTGEIFLTTPIRTEDSSLLKVDYTTQRRHYYFKRSGDTLLNFNPYQNSSPDLIGRANYIYILPQYVVDEGGLVIPESVTDEPLRFSASPEIFDLMRPEYDPLAVLLGIIYVSAALDISDLTLLDTRRRGGGGRDGAATEELVRLVQEASTYWDVGYGAGTSYQKAGFVVVRLPEELKDEFTEMQIVEAIERNITAGVRYKIEDLAGNDWS